MLHTINIIHVLFNLSVIFVVAKCFGEIALFCGQSEIIGEIVAGILIGPNVLNLLYDTPTPMLLIMAEIGSIILLFDVGLSINIKNFVKSSKFALLVAISGIIMPYILSYLVLINFNFKNINAIFTAAIFTATSIAVTARILKDSNKLSTQEAEIVLGAAFIDDILGVIILTIISNIVIGNKISLYSINKILIKIIL
ncbi:MAG: cation:proton antiporter, partial [Endomicrobium sp.]|nr:cation:proton antiporter [Endomicrobium sp.]